MAPLTQQIVAAIRACPAGPTAVAREAGLPQPLLSYWLNGTREASPEQARKVTRALQAIAKRCQHAADLATRRKP